jgi:hypothetical protein
LSSLVIFEGETKLSVQAAMIAVMRPVLLVLRTQLQVVMRGSMPIAMLELKPPEMRTVEQRFLKERVLMAIMIKVARRLIQATTTEVERGLPQQLVKTTVREVSKATRKPAIPATQPLMNCGGLRPRRPMIQMLSAPEETMSLN